MRHHALAALAAADGEPERRLPQGTLTPVMRRVLLRHIIRLEIAHEARSNSDAVGPALAYRTDVSSVDRSDGARASEEAVAWSAATLRPRSALWP